MFLQYVKFCFYYISLFYSSPSSPVLGKMLLIPYVSHGTPEFYTHSCKLNPRTYPLLYLLMIDENAHKTVTGNNGK